MRRALAFVLVMLAVDAIGLGLILPVLPALIQEVSGGSLANAAEWGGVLATSFAVMQFLFGPLVGSLSDRYGRRPVLLISFALLSAHLALMSVAGTIALLLVARIIGGAASATQAAANAFIADVSRPEDKAANFGLAGAAFGLGFVLGPAIGGLLGTLGPRAPFQAAAALAALNLVFGVFVLPETLRRPRPFAWRAASPLGAFRSIGALPELGRLLILVFLYEFAFVVYPATWAFFGTERFGWDTATIGLSLALFGISFAIVQGVLLRPLSRRFGDRLLVLIGLCFNTLAFAALMLVESGTLALILTPVAALGAVVVPSLQGIMSRAVSDDRQGELQGAVTAARALAFVTSPLAMALVFARFTEPPGLYLPGAAFGLAMLVMLACLALWITRRPSASPT